MSRQVEIRVGVDDINDQSLIKNRLEKQVETDSRFISSYKLLRRSLDARQKIPYYVLRYEVYFEGEKPEEDYYDPGYHSVHSSPPIHIIGTGPAGYFAALECLRFGYKPILFERGKDVQARRRDLKKLQQESIVNPDSNYCFGEGGAGTYSDGKLYTRSGNKKKIKEVLRVLHYHGAAESILVDAHPHIGSNKLPKVIAEMRQTIEAMGGEIYFSSALTDIKIADDKIQSIVINGDQTENVEKLILATGHSARDVFELLYHKKIMIEQKDFALGVRIEHPQALINAIQYHGYRSSHLPAASYSLVSQVENRGVYSFCMCPGGLIVPAATSPGEIVLNGMSLSRRDSPFANSGVVTEIKSADLKEFKSFGPLAGMKFQEQVEQAVFNHGDGSQRAPALRLDDFLRQKVSTTLPHSSYIPQIYAAPLYDILPTFINKALQKGVKDFNAKMPGYLTSEAVIVGVESRTSSPVRIPRDPKTSQHPQIKNLYPTGEGAGYAGGIVSAAIDGQNVVKNIVNIG